MGGQKKDVPVATIAAGIDVMRDFLATFVNNGYAQAFLMDNDGKLFVRINTGQPCQGGEMRTYGAGSTRPNDYRPGDLYTPFPDGTPLAVAIPFRNPTDWNDMMTDVVFNIAHSPWRSVTDGATLYTNANGKYNGVIFHDTDVDSTVLVNLCRGTNSQMSSGAKRYNELVKLFPKRDKVVLFIAAIQFVHLSKANGVSIMDGNNAYSMFSGAPDFKRIYTGDTIDLTGGTFKNRYAYNRPEIDFVFGKNVHNLDKIVAEAFGVKPRGYHSYDKIGDILNIIEGLCH